MPPPQIASLALPGVACLISFLSYSSPYLFRHIDPGPLSSRQTVTFNVLVACIWICYYRACFTNPGGMPREAVHDESEGDNGGNSVGANGRRRLRWCRKCDAPKLPRAHHCKECKQCIPKMDHHCPWTANCVSHTNFPHFIRFVFYAVAAMTYLEYFLYVRGAVVWNTRHLPSYLGPSLTQLVHFFVLILVNSITLFALSILLVRVTWSLGANVTTIEGWEIERHAALVRRARIMGGYVLGPDGVKVRLVKQEFPYDIGIWKNLKQGMGGGNVLEWFWPFAKTPSIEGALDYEVNGFEDTGVSWPPPDPERIPRASRLNDSGAFMYKGADMGPTNEVEAFRRRQQVDLKRWQVPDHSALADGEEGGGSDGENSASSAAMDEEPWTNAEGDRLKDFGVDEEEELYDEDDIPLAELMKKRR